MWEVGVAATMALSATQNAAYGSLSLTPLHKIQHRLHTSADFAGLNFYDFTSSPSVVTKGALHSLMDLPYCGLYDSP